MVWKNFHFYIPRAIARFARWALHRIAFRGGAFVAERCTRRKAPRSPILSPDPLPIALWNGLARVFSLLLVTFEYYAGGQLGATLAFGRYQFS